MSDTPASQQSVDRFAPPRDDQSQQASVPTSLRIRFTGSGIEYFRIWIVNLLLIIITLTLYYPWARVRKLVYLAQNTEIAGYPLSFHGAARRMFPGFLIALIGGIAYLVSQEMLPVVSGILLLIYLLAWPWIFRMAHRFRLAKTEWRGLPFGFSGTNGEAYLVFLVPLLVYAAIFGVGIFAGANDSTSPDDANNLLSDEIGPITVWASAMAIIGVFGAPYFLFLVKRYQHNNLSYGSLKTKFTAGAGGFYMIAVKTTLLTIAIGIGLVAAVIVALIIGGAMIGLSMNAINDIDWVGPGLVATYIALSAGAYVVFYLLFSAIGAYTKSALFNLTWANTITTGTHFVPNLRFSRLWRLQMKNTLLILLTLGLYIPFAQIAVVRMKLESLHIETEQNLESIIADVQTGRVSAAVDAAADMLDVDISF